MVWFVRAGIRSFDRSFRNRWIQTTFLEYVDFLSSFAPPFIHSVVGSCSDNNDEESSVVGALSRADFFFSCFL